MSSLDFTGILGVHRGGRDVVAGGLQEAALIACMPSFSRSTLRVLRISRCPAFPLVGMWDTGCLH